MTVENDVGPMAITKDGFYRRGTCQDYPDAREVGYYYQYAKTFVRLGHFCATCGEVVYPTEIVHLGHDLEVVVAPGAYRVGDEVILAGHEGPFCPAEAEVDFRGLFALISGYFNNQLRRCLGVFKIAGFRVIYGPSTAGRVYEEAVGAGKRARWRKQFWSEKRFPTSAGPRLTR